jgi:hypothetical protein
MRVKWLATVRGLVSVLMRSVEGAKVSSLEQPDYRFVGADVHAPKFRGYSSVQPLPVSEETGYYRPPTPKPTKKAADEAKPVSSGQCAVCKRGVQESEDIIRHSSYVGHRACLLELAALMQPEPLVSKAYSSYQGRHHNEREQARAAALRGQARSLEHKF